MKTNFNVELVLLPEGYGSVNSLPWNLNHDCIKIDGKLYSKVNAFTKTGRESSKRQHWNGYLHDLQYFVYQLNNPKVNTEGFWFLGSKYYRREAIMMIEDLCKEITSTKMNFN